MDQRVKRSAASNAGARTRKPAGQTLAEHLKDTIQSAVMLGRYAPGQRLVEAELMQEYGVSRGAIRELLRLLAADGLVTIEPYRGAVVAPLTRKRMEDAFDIRELLEGLAAGSVAERMASGDLERAAVEQKLRDFAETGPGDKNEYMERNVRFHNYIAELSANIYLPRMLTRLQVPAVRSQFPSTLDAKGVEASRIEHLHIAEAICSGDRARATKAMHIHIRRTAKLTRRLPDDLFPEVQAEP